MINVEELVEIILPNPDNFLKIKETLTRIGIASKKNNTLHQSCHILHKRGKYYILSFKELFLLDGKQSDFTEDDKSRRNTIINLLEEWKLLTIVDKTKIENRMPLSQIKILPFDEKKNWVLAPKYRIGNTGKSKPAV